MALNASYGHGMDHPLFVHGNSLGQQAHPFEDYQEVDQTWFDYVDPSIRQGRSVNHSTSTWQQQQPLRRFVTEPERYLFATGPIPMRDQVNRPTINGITAFPRGLDPRTASPTASQSISSPASSCARSPRIDHEPWHDPYYPSQVQAQPSTSNSMPHFPHGSTDIWPERLQGTQYSQPSGQSCVNMSQVQGFADPQQFADPQDDIFEADKRNLNVHRPEYTIKADQRTVGDCEWSVPHPNFRANKNMHEVPIIDGTPQGPESVVSETDADDDVEADDDIPESEASDDEYKPNAIRGGKRRPNAPKPSPLSSVKQGRVTKAKPAKSPRLSRPILQPTCKNCKTPFRDAASLQHHLDHAHPRVFTCVFGFAGCQSTFASKNEWKRHVSTKHLNFHSWICDLGPCGKAHMSSSLPSTSKSGSVLQTIKVSMFNRKDLFTQHLRRMHSPNSIKLQRKQDDEWEYKIRDLQKSCLHVIRHPPSSLGCPASLCESRFSGATCWDDRMEHVAKHLDGTLGPEGPSGLHQESDEALVNWALEERIIEHTGRGYQLTGAGAFDDRLFDMDAEGEDDF